MHCALLIALSTTLAATGPEDFHVRSGYRVTTAVESLEGARFLAVDDRGTLYVSRPRSGDIVAFTDRNADGVYERLGTFVEDRRLVHGLQFKDGWLWFSTSGGVSKARDLNGDGRADEVEDVLIGLPSGGGHWWRSILVTDDRIYTSIGDEGNATDQQETDRQKIWSFALDGSDMALFCSGIRNTEKLRLRPGTDEIWGFDHGSDWFGKEIGDEQGNQPITDLNPPDELNHYVSGGFYGHPFIVGTRLPRYEYMDRPDIHELAAKTTPPEWCVGAHWACNGWTFIDPALNKGQFPADHEGDIVVASHGSWNRSERAGYCVSRILFDGAKAYGLLKIVSTVSEDGQTVYARPVDVIQAPDGSLLFSDDYAGAVYRIEYVGERGAS